MAQDITSSTGNESVEWLLAEEFKIRHKSLEVLVNNAGAFFMKYGETVDGIENTFALSHLNYFLLTNLLLEPLKAAAPSRIINVASGAHKGAEIQLEDPSLEEHYSGCQAYGQSKLTNVMFTYELARRLEDTGVTSTPCTPERLRPTSTLTKRPGTSARFCPFSGSSRPRPKKARVPPSTWPHPPKSRGLAANTSPTRNRLPRLRFPVMRS